MSGGARTILRIAAELQLGLAGVNWRQQTITQFFKPTLKTVKFKVKRSWVDQPAAPLGGPIRKKDKYNIDPILLKKNKNLTVFNVFDSIVQTDEIVYWEFKAG